MHLSRRIALSLLAMATIAVHAQERKIARTALPPAVEKTVQANTQGATIKGFATEMEAGKKVFEAETVVNGHTRDIQIAADGTLNEIEEEVAFDALPMTVQKALSAKAGAAKIAKVESLTKKGKLVAYEAATLAGAKKGEVQVGPNGETLKREE